MSPVCYVSFRLWEASKDFQGDQRNRCKVRVARFGLGPTIGRRSLEAGVQQAIVFLCEIKCTYALKKIDTTTVEITIQ
ncbi:hypothetical protein GWI33_003640 [Rhynchophorus ferrugineus]|uniref:Uncharacterized protein n=1 Tax=Rhynchophorus ferrugineus TaxID=354439 RepID=A0A834HNK3_RHYFE|nr:hypothetical protein GWI33_003640 [Rhynchophorus ferrugineus]